MPAPLECSCDRLLSRICLLAVSERPNPFHQVIAQSRPELVRLARGEHSSGLVLFEAMLWRVSGLPDVKWSEGTRPTHTVSREFDDVDGVNGTRRIGAAPCHGKVIDCKRSTIHPSMPDVGMHRIRAWCVAGLPHGQ